MCSRYSLTSPPEAVRAYFGYADTPNFPARYNIAPTQPIPVVCVDREGARRFRLMRWGLLPSFVKDPKKFPTLINARSETILQKAPFKREASERRCLVPADGFFEWKREADHRRRISSGLSRTNPSRLPACGLRRPAIFRADTFCSPPRQTA